MTISRKPRLIIMVKEPRPGRVKTRLGRDIGMVDAAWWFRHQVAHLLRDLRAPRWDIVLAVSPDTALGGAAWPPDLPRVPQGRGDLGARMARLLRMPHGGPVCLVGGDIPSLESHHITRAFAVLGGTDAVFGPATDGGFWLAGLRHPSRAPSGLFQNVRWSSEHALRDSIKSLSSHRYALADTLQDVDTAADLPQNR